MRRLAIVTLAAVLVSLPLLAQEAKQEAQQEAKPITPDQLWAALMQGNKQFVAGNLKYTNLQQERDLLDESQMPPISVLSCSDSRVPPELIFNQSLGTLFVVRSAGNVADEFGIASLEFAISQGYTKLLVVLGHESCGAVKASLGGADPGTPSLMALARRIRYSFVGIPYDSRNPENVERAVRANAKASAAQLLAGSALIRDAVATERIKIVTATYDLNTGEVTKIE